VSNIPEKIKFPPKELISPSGAEKKDFEYIILWMLDNNEECNWSTFLEKPLEISLATLSKYINQLKRKGFISKVSKGVYKITPKGKKRVFDLKYKDSYRKELKYPPNLIYNKHNYSHIILWMLYNNKSCKWSDFIEKPLSINSHSLSKHINRLIKEEFIEIHDSRYKISETGEKEYSKLLKIYNLDYQSILVEDLRKFEQIKEDLGDFFNKWNINDEQIKLTFLDLLNHFDYAKIKGTISSEEDFHKLILFLSMNNLTMYPSHVTTETFSKKYEISQTALKFLLQKLLEADLFQIQLFEFSIKNQQKYYFRAGEKIEKTIKLIVDEDIKNYSLQHLTEIKMTLEERKNHSIIIFKNIINDLSVNLFNGILKLQIIDFLLKYFGFLFESLKRKMPTNINDKFKILVFQDILNLSEDDIGKVKKELYQLTPLLWNFPKYKILDELKKKIEDSDFE
jgi:Mn-dependent DtxR family transcriptional regulator